MKKLVSVTLLVFLTVVAVLAQGGPAPRRYSAYVSKVLSGASTALTVQQPATGATIVTFKDAWVYSSASCDISITKGGTAATTTAGTAYANSSHFPAAAAKVLTDSDVGAGTTRVTVTLNASDKAFDLTGYELQGVAQTENLTLKTGTCTATVRLLLVWEER